MADDDEDDVGDDDAGRAAQGVTASVDAAPPMVAPPAPIAADATAAAAADVTDDTADAAAANATELPLPPLMLMLDAVAKWPAADDGALLDLLIVLLPFSRKS